jgi:hypothetical protein
MLNFSKLAYASGHPLYWVYSPLYKAGDEIKFVFGKNSDIYTSSVG